MAGFRAAAVEVVHEFVHTTGQGCSGASGAGAALAAAGAEVRPHTMTRLPGGFCLDAWLAGRRAIEARVGDPDGRCWDDPLLPWRFVEQVC